MAIWPDFLKTSLKTLLGIMGDAWQGRKGGSGRDWRQGGQLGG